MFLGVVTRPIPHRNFDGRILLERVSKQTTVSKLTAHTNFSDDVLINSAIKKGERKDLFQGNKELTVGEIIDTISLYYGLEEYISDRMELSYTIYIGDKGNTKNIKLDNNINIFAVFFNEYR